MAANLQISYITVCVAGLYTVSKILSTCDHASTKKISQSETYLSTPLASSVCVLDMVGGDPRPFPNISIPVIQQRIAARNTSDQFMLFLYLDLFPSRESPLRSQC